MRKIVFACLLVASCGSPPESTEDGAGGGGDAAAPDLSMPEGCSPKCTGLTTFCNDTKHCVGCLKDGDCAMGSYCKIASETVANCAVGCNADANCANGQKCCANQCASTDTDVKNCGGCGMPCQAMHAQASCVAGKCGSGKCDSGWGDCNKDAADGCEANLHADVANCTGCGMSCALANATPGCADGCYIAACKFGFDDCNVNMADGCETSVLADKNNCGGCGKTCAGIANAMAGCVNGSCQIASCNLGFADCDKNAANGCEVTVGTDAKNCGACGNVCGNGLICVQGGCTCPNCNIPNASALCVNNMCVFDKCNPGFGDCNNNKGDGCEVNLTNDVKNCSACGMACGMNQTCSNAMCGNGPIWVFGNYGGGPTMFNANMQYNGQVSCPTTCMQVGLKAVGARFVCNVWQNNVAEGCTPMTNNMYGTANCDVWIDQGQRKFLMNNEDCAGNIAGCVAGACNEGVTWHAISCQCAP